MVEYVVDGSAKGLDQGIGIVRIEGHKQQCMSFHNKIGNRMIGKHEENAIVKTLEVIAENNDKDVVIYNDSRTVVSRLKGGQIKKKQVELKKIKNIVDSLENKGYSIKFAHMDRAGKRRECKKAHELSRNYIKVH